MKRRNLTIAVLLMFITIMVAGGCRQESLFDRNLIKNGDGSDGPAVPYDGVWEPPKHWDNTFGTMWISKYGEGAGSELAEAESRGENDYYFWGGINSDGVIEQITDISRISELTDAGEVRYELSALLGGYRNQNDRAKLTANFLDSEGETLFSEQIGPVTNRDRNNITTMLRREAEGMVPPGTRKIHFELRAIVEVGSNNDGYADELSMILRRR